LLVAPVSAQPESISSGSSPFSAQGFDNANRVLTLQAEGAETGSLFPLDDGLDGTGDVVSPLSDHQTFGRPPLGDLNLTAASDGELLFNAIEPNGDGATIDSLTPAFFSGNTSLFSISNPEPLVLASDPPPPAADEIALSPAAWLFVSGFLGLGMLGYRRKRRQRGYSAAAEPDGVPAGP
jgi:hypothetical protein